MALFRISDVISHHHRSLGEHGRPALIVAGALYGPPIAVAAAAVAGNRYWPDRVVFDSGIGSSLTVALGLFAGVLFGLSVTILEKAVDMDVAGTPPGRSTDRTALRLQGLAASTLFTAMVAAAATAALVVAELVPDAANAATTVALAAMALVATNGALIAGRVFAETKRRTNRARTGESRSSRVDSRSDTSHFESPGDSGLG